MDSGGKPGKWAAAPSPGVCSVSDCRLLPVETVEDPRGSLGVVDTGVGKSGHLPFPIQRVFYLYGVPAGGRRAGHALRRCHQFLVAVSGRFRVLLRDGVEERSLQLDSPREGLWIPPMVWRELEGFSDGAVCVVLASEPYEESAYLRTYGEYLAATQG